MAKKQVVTKKKTNGRPREMTDEMKNEVIAGVASGRSFLDMAKVVGLNINTLYAEITRDKSFLDRWLAARVTAADLMVEEIKQISDNPSGEPARDRLRVETRRWIMTKIKPESYADRLVQSITGPNDGPVKVEHSGSVSAPALEAFAAKLAELAKPQS